MMGVNPFEVVAKHSNRDLKFAFQFRSLGRLVGELIERGAVANPPSTSISSPC
jgi:hypothetical protein